MCGEHSKVRAWAKGKGSMSEEDSTVASGPSHGKVAAKREQRVDRREDRMRERRVEGITEDRRERREEVRTGGEQ